MDPMSRGPQLARELGCVVPGLLRIISSKHFNSYTVFK